MTPFGIDKNHLNDLNPDEAAKLFRNLLWANAFKFGIDPSLITISENQDVKDGGIDAAIKDHNKADSSHPLLAPRSRFQLKTGNSAKPWQPSWTTKELFGGKRKRSRQALASEVARCLEENGRYTVVLFGHDLQPKDRTNAEALIREAFRACGFENAQVDVWGQAQIESELRHFPGICLSLSGSAAGQFYSHVECASFTQMLPPFECDEKIEKAIAEIRASIRQDDSKPIRYVGEPGRGKTRLILEATRQEDLAPLVIYAPEAATVVASKLIQELLRPWGQN